MRTRRSSNKLKYQREVKKRQEESKNNLDLFLEEYSKLDTPYDKLIVKNDFTASFFKEISLETNKIHIISGNNGQGKSTLLKNIANSLCANNLSEIPTRMKICSNNKKISDFFNQNLEFSPFKMDDNNMFNHSIYNMSNFKNAIMFYIDFTVSFFRENSFDMITDALEEYHEHSNGERKIKAINSLFAHLKFFLNFNIDRIEKGFNFVFIMDEPESGLSQEIQIEFYKKVRRFLNKAIKNKKISLTFIIASHSLIWQGSNDKNIIIHNIYDFKNLEDSDIKIKKNYKKVFI